MTTSALTDLLESGWIIEEQAMQIAADWLFNSPNRSYDRGSNFIGVGF